MNILISGAASGIGSATADCFLKNGHRVYSVDLKPLALREGQTHFVADICDTNALKAIFTQLNNLTFDVILDIAGIHDMLSFAETDPGRFERLIRVNLLGHAGFNQVFYPLLSPHGRIVILTSEVACLDPLPFNGGYSVSKTALDCYAQALRQELNLLGQKVVTVRPGAVETALCSSSLDATQRLADETALFKAQASRFVRIAKRFMGTPMPCDRLAERIYRESVAKRPRFIVRVHTNPGLRLLSLLPKRAQCGLIRALLNFHLKDTEEKT